jgi:hypothetical protein
MAGDVLDPPPSGTPDGGGRRSGRDDPASADLLSRQAEDLVRPLRRWTASSWRLPPEGPAPDTRAEAAHLAVQRIADLGADAELRTRRPVPRINDLVLADQLAVVIGDVVRTGDPTAVRETARVLDMLRVVLGLRPARA